MAQLEKIEGEVETEQVRDDNAVENTDHEASSSREKTEINNKQNCI